jgi:TM2 domain-containing membrane protein YozV
MLRNVSRVRIYCVAFSICIPLLCFSAAENIAGGPDSSSCSTTGYPPQSVLKNPELAGALSVFLPGLGHIYAGETLKGSILTGLFGVAIGTTIAANIGSTHDSIRPQGWASVAFVSAVYLYALIDAPFAANRANAALRSSGAHLLSIPTTMGVLTMDAGISRGMVGVGVSFCLRN